MSIPCGCTGGRTTGAITGAGVEAALLAVVSSLWNVRVATSALHGGFLSVGG